MDTEEGKKSTTNHKINLYSYTLKIFCVFVGVQSETGVKGEFQAEKAQKMRKHQMM